ncbi:MAG: hypothetical protein ABWX96_19040 [Propionibacteriaceae bacterium]
MPDRLTTDDVACWVLKTRTAPADIAPDWSRGTARELTRCLRRSYRVELMQPGQRCLLWLSGSVGPGVQAIGTLTSDATVGVERDAAGRDVEVSGSLLWLEDPVSRSALLADPDFAGAEVLRMPAGSNPSYLTAAALESLREHINPRDRDRAGW